MTNHGFLDKPWLIERLQPLHPHPSLLTSLGKEQIATTSPLGEGKILRAGTELR
jgi:hypothetical protein